MNKQIKKIFYNWKSWIENEKRLAFNTSQSYSIDLQSFLNFLSNHNNLNVDLKTIINVDEDDLSGWFYERLKKSQQ